MDATILESQTSLSMGWEVGLPKLGNTTHVRKRTQTQLVRNPYHRTDCGRCNALGAVPLLWGECK